MNKIQIIDYLYDLREKYEVIGLNPCLGEFFFKFDYDPRNIFKVETKKHDYKKVAIHFRGTDFKKWNPESILDLDYYINSIDYVGTTNTKFFIYTDDKDLRSFTGVVDYLKINNIAFDYGPATLYAGQHYVKDFIDMCDSDTIISSPSTFAICAGFIGKYKDIIHSKKWVDSRIEKDDQFWINIKNNESDFYNVKKLI